MVALVLKHENYFSADAAREYMSASLYKSFLDCEARAMAGLAGTYCPEPTQALLVGGYADAHFSGEMELFREQHPEICTRSGGLRAEYQQADEIIARIERDPLAMMMLDGERQKIVTGEMNGVLFRGKLDVLLGARQCEAVAQAYPAMDELLFASGAIVDLKIVRDFEPLYKAEEGRQGFITYWRYDLQMAIYQRLVGGSLPCYILAATKEKVPDIGLFLLPQSLLDAAMEIYLSGLKRVAAVWKELAEPERCEKCDHCKQTKVLTCGVCEEYW